MLVTGILRAHAHRGQVKDELYIYDNTGEKLNRLAADFVGAVTVTAREIEPWLFVTLTGFNTPGTVGRYDLQQPEEKRWSIYRTTKVKGLNPDEFEAQQVIHH